MTLYSLALFVHIVGALLLFTAFTSEGIALFHLRRSTTSAQVREWEGVAGLARIFGPASVVTILASGLAMMISTWGWVPWIAVGTHRLGPRRSHGRPERHPPEPCRSVGT